MHYFCAIFLRVVYAADSLLVVPSNNTIQPAWQANFADDIITIKFNTDDTLSRENFIEMLKGIKTLYVSVSNSINKKFDEALTAFNADKDMDSYKQSIECALAQAKEYMMQFLSFIVMQTSRFDSNHDDYGNTMYVEKIHADHFLCLKALLLGNTKNLVYKSNSKKFLQHYKKKLEIYNKSLWSEILGYLESDFSMCKWRKSCRSLDKTKAPKSGLFILQEVPNFLYDYKSKPYTCERSQAKTKKLMSAHYLWLALCDEHKEQIKIDKQTTKKLYKIWEKEVLYPVRKLVIAFTMKKKTTEQTVDKNAEEKIGEEKTSVTDDRRTNVNDDKMTEMSVDNKATVTEYKKACMSDDEKTIVTDNKKIKDDSEDDDIDDIAVFLRVLRLCLKEHGAQMRILDKQLINIFDKPYMRLKQKYFALKRKLYFAMNFCDSFDDFIENAEEISGKRRKIIIKTRCLRFRMLFNEFYSDYEIFLDAVNVYAKEAIVTIYKKEETYALHPYLVLKTDNFGLNKYVDFVNDLRDRYTLHLKTINAAIAFINSFQSSQIDQFCSFNAKSSDFLSSINITTYNDSMVNTKCEIEKCQKVAIVYLKLYDFLNSQGYNESSDRIFE